MNDPSGQTHRNGSDQSIDGSIATDPRTQILPFSIFVALLVLSKINLGYYGLLVSLAMALSATVYLFNQKKTFRDILFYSSVEEDSWLQWFRRRFIYLWVISFFLSCILILSISVHLITTHLLILFILAIPQFTFPQVRSFFYGLLTLQLKIRSRNCIINTLSVITLGTTTLMLMIGAKYLELMMFVERSVLPTSDSMATYVIEKVQHGIPLIQHLGRTLSMFELELLRARELSGGLMGDIILIYYLLPSTLAAFALPIIYAGIHHFFSKQNNASAY